MERRLQEAIRLREAGDHQKANEQFIGLIRDFPEDAVVNYQCAWSFDVLGEEAKAVPFYERAMVVFPANQVLPIFYSMTLYNLQEHGKAMELLLKCVAETSVNPDIVSYKGAIKFYSTQLDKVWN